MKLVMFLRNWHSTAFCPWSGIGSSHRKQLFCEIICLFNLIWNLFVLLLALIPKYRNWNKRVIVWLQKQFFFCQMHTVGMHDETCVEIQWQRLLRNIHSDIMGTFFFKKSASIWAMKFAECLFSFHCSEYIPHFLSDTRIISLTQSSRMRELCLNEIVHTSKLACNDRINLLFYVGKPWNKHRMQSYKKKKKKHPDILDGIVFVCSLPVLSQNLWIWECVEQRRKQGVVPAKL